MRWLARLGFVLLLPCAMPALGCNRRAVESWLSEAEKARGPSLYSVEGFSEALAQVQKRAPSPIQALSVLVYSDHLVLQCQDPATPANAVQYVYRNGGVTGPVAVKLLGTGKLADNVFPLEAVKLSGIPTLAREAQEKANIPEGHVSRILVKRNLPDSADVQFRVFVTSERRDAYFDADQNAKWIE